VSPRARYGRLLGSPPRPGGATNLLRATLTLTPALGFELNLESLQFDGSRQFFQPAIPSAVFLVSLRSNLDGFASDVDTSFWNAGSDPTGFTTLSLDLSTAPFQGLTASTLAGVGGSLQLALYFGQFSSADFSLLNHIDNVVVNGTTAVPEPAVSGLLATALLGLALRASLRRRAHATHGRSGAGTR